MEGIANWLQSFLNREPAEPQVVRFKADEWKEVQSVVSELDHLTTPGPQNEETENRVSDLIEGKCFDNSKKALVTDDTGLSWMLADLLQSHAKAILSDIKADDTASVASAQRRVQAAFDASIKCFRHAGGILPTTHR